MIRKAEPTDLDNLYQLGLQTPELQVSSTEPFMPKDELAWAIQNPDGVFLVAEQSESAEQSRTITEPIHPTKKLVGFIYANANDKDKAFQDKYACIIYLTVIPEFRKLGIAKDLYKECEQKLKSIGITSIYSWAKIDDNFKNETPIIDFMKKQGFKPGKSYLWMDKKIT